MKLPIENKYEKVITANDYGKLNRIKGVTPSNTMFAAIEKIHGSNFSFHIDCKTNEVKFASRNEYIEDGDSFFNHKQIVEKYLPIVKKFACYGEESVIIFGELFGGNFYDMETTCGSVQRGVNYTPDNEFMAFDIKIDGRYIPYGNFTSIIKIINDENKDLQPLQEVPLIQVATLDELLDIDVDSLTSTVYKNYGLEVPDERCNLPVCEGIVIRPYFNEFTDERCNVSHRVMLKYKSTKFAEVIKKRKENKIIELSDNGNELLQKLSEYVTPSRVSNVFSKIGEPSMANIGKAIKGMIGDIREDYKIDNGYDFCIDKKDTLKEISKNYNILISNEVKKFVMG